MPSTRPLGAIWLAAALGVAGCSSLAPRECDAGAQPVIQDALYFGTATPGGSIADSEFDAFVSGTITPRFPQGLTTWNASGQWQGKDGRIVREASHVLLLVHADDARSERAVLEIISAYKSQFQQEAVLRVKTAGCATPASGAP